MNKFPPGWDEARVKKMIEHYDSLDEDGWVAEYEAALEREGETLISVPTATSAGDSGINPPA